MEGILRKIQSLNGVHEVCIYRDGESVASTLPEHQVGAVGGVFHLVEQIFAALESIGKDHNELYFSFADKLIAVYALSDCGIVMLVTDKKINLPLIHMGVKAAASKIRTVLSVPSVSSPASAPAIQVEPVLTAPTISAPPPAPVLSTQPAEPPRIDNVTQIMLGQLETLLTSYFGPAAHFIFSEAQEEWMQKHSPNRYNTNYLVNALLVEFDSEAERVAFQQRAKNIISP
ncbi:MAG: hypothetical protein PHE17_00735 [Thiothrix sp.]|uniref:hypothetical protein n=1 Tax=Thiothrix sp. TaxID=1032 RepID=UPI0026334297|nr:hypothetical protein [Thiothrix sp.]MDD5391519.1 hypothetical protein [Thiothrix sp.]